MDKNICLDTSVCGGWHFFEQSTSPCWASFYQAPDVVLYPKGEEAKTIYQYAADKFLICIWPKKDTIRRRLHLWVQTKKQDALGYCHTK